MAPGGVGAAHMAEVDRAPVGIAVATRAVDLRAQVSGREADGTDIVVTAGAARGEVCVVDLHRAPGECSMTAVALLRRRDVRAWQADGAHRVVTRGAAVRGDGGVVEARRRPRGRGVAAIAGCGR